MTAPLGAELVRRVVTAALAEDLGDAGDITTNALVGPDTPGVARIVARAPGRVAGVDVGCDAFEQLDARVAINVLRHDGSDVRPGDVIAVVDGPARAILTGERVCLNLIGRLSGIATATRDMVAAIEGTGATIADTRKTTPGLRALEKYAVRVGGGSNHRFGLYDAAMIKDNHIAATGSIGAAVAAVRAATGHTVKVEVEAETLEQAREAVAAGADIVLLDNMDPRELAAAVAAIDGRAIVEASGGVSIATVRSIAESGVDIISAGAITHSAPQLDVALDFD